MHVYFHGLACLLLLLDRLKTDSIDPIQELLKRAEVYLALGYRTKLGQIRIYEACLLNFVEVLSEILSYECEVLNLCCL